MARSELNSGTGRTTDLPAALWALCSRPLALWIPGLVILLLGLAGLWLPQMPGQLVNEPASAARWLEGATDAPLGDLWRTLGLYSVLTHPVLSIALAALLAILAVRVAQQVTAWQAHHQWTRQAIEMPVETPGLPATLNSGAPLQRLRRAASHPPESVAIQIDQILEHADISRYNRASVPYADSTEPPETRLFWTSNLLWAILPLLRDSALLLAFAVAWSIIVFGWHIATPILAPGERFHSSALDLQIQYPLDPEMSAALHSGLQHVGTSALQISTQNARQAAGDLVVFTRQAAPGLILSSPAQSESALRRLGEGESVSALGLVLPEPGDEETVLLPELAAGLRIVRRAGDQSMWLVEYYAAGDVQPRAHWDIQAGTTTTLVLPDSQVEIQVEPAAGIQFEVYHMPAHRLIWLGIGIALLSAIGTVRRPFFALIQVGPWHNESVVIVQTSDMNNQALQSLFQQKVIWQPPPSPDTGTTWQTSTVQGRSP
jgi:hypothetical protein